MKNLAILSLLVVTAAANAQSILATGFESPAWSAGTNGANVTATANSSQGWAVDGTASLASIVATGQTNAGGVSAVGGTQMLRMSTATTAASAAYAYKDITSAWNGRTSGNNVLHASTQFYVPTTNLRTSIYGLQAYNPTVDLLGGIVIDPGYDAASSLSAIYVENDTDVAGYTINRADFVGRWNTLDLYVDFDAATAHGTVTIGATTLDLGTLPVSATFLAGGLSDVDFFATNGGVAQTGTTAATNSVYFDNYSVVATTAPVPEPATLAALGVGAVALLRRRKKA